MTAQQRRNISVWGVILALAGSIGTLGVALAYVSPILAIPETVKAQGVDLVAVEAKAASLEMGQAVIYEKISTIAKQNEEIKATQQEILNRLPRN